MRTLVAGRAYKSAGRREREREIESGAGDDYWERTDPGCAVTNVGYGSSYRERAYPGIPRKACPGAS
eukprot:366045-Chlamydomonas_euryale.AAC.14